MPIAAKHQQAPLDFGTLTAGEITSAILAYLTTQGYTVWRQNTTGIYERPLWGRHQALARQPPG